ncbi:nuclear transport factor 2 family protein [Flavivirga algicola]|uniref:Ester cyclase n=1 Tax=Flavivirga algicola TaxID=2729136 RepID=A0ABX1S4C1_9FLAO|nr:nuclear transport factor 2 family protein [Flavivirga algicola]NMH89497.1 ester cyclase [Flavivirga algicola]
MKKILVMLLAVTLFIACKKKPQRYFAESAEIETLKSGINAYETGNWDKWKSHFSDTAKIFVNSIKPLSVEKRLEDLKAMTNTMSAYGFNHDKEYIEMVLDKEDETWVYYWATHVGTFAANKKELTIPVHLAVQFVEGKIVEEHIYFDGTAMNSQFAALAAAEAEAKTATKDLED